MEHLRALIYFMDPFLISFVLVTIFIKAANIYPSWIGVETWSVSKVAPCLTNLKWILTPLFFAISKISSKINLTFSFIINQLLSFLNDYSTSIRFSLNIFTYNIHWKFRIMECDHYWFYFSRKYQIRISLWLFPYP